MARVSHTLLKNELDFWLEMYNKHEGQMKSFSRYMDDKYCFRDKELLKIEKPTDAYEYIRKHHGQKAI